jgi:hypothetical protein
VYYLPQSDCLISHGECDIACLTLSGEIKWTATGKDIFSEGFSISDDHIEVTDFNHEKYRIDLADGHIQLISR